MLKSMKKYRQLPETVLKCTKVPFLFRRGLENVQRVATALKPSSLEIFGG